MIWPRRWRPRASPAVGFWLVAVALVITMLGTTLPTPLYPLFEARYGFGGFVVTLIYAVYSLGVIAALLLFGTLSDQIGRRRLLVPALLLSGLSAVVFLVADSTVDLFLGRVLSGLSVGIGAGTATAAMVDLAPDGSRDRASLVATTATVSGLGLGPLLAGVLAQYAPRPLRLSFVIDLALVVVALACVAATPESMPTRGRIRVRVRRLRVPRPVRRTFMSAVIGGGAGFAVFGLYAGLAPAVLDKVLRQHNHALTGLVVFAAFAASAVSQVITARLPPRLALLTGCVGLAGGSLIVGASLLAASLALLVAGAVVSGLAQGLVFRAGLTMLDVISPADQRSDVASGFFVAIYVAIAVPVVTVGALAIGTGLVIAGAIFAGLVSVVPVVAFVSLLSRPPP